MSGNKNLIACRQFLFSPPKNLACNWGNFRNLNVPYVAYQAIHVICRWLSKRTCPLSRDEKWGQDKMVSVLTEQWHAWKYNKMHRLKRPRKHQVSAKMQKPENLKYCRSLKA